MNGDWPADRESLAREMAADVGGLASWGDMNAWTRMIFGMLADLALEPDRRAVVFCQTDSRTFELEQQVARYVMRLTSCRPSDRSGLSPFAVRAATNVYEVRSPSHRIRYVSFNYHLSEKDAFDFAVVNFERRGMSPLWAYFDPELSAPHWLLGEPRRIA